MEINAKSLANRKQMLVAELDGAMANLWKIRGALIEVELMEQFLSMDTVSQEEMDKVKEFPASESR